MKQNVNEMEQAVENMMKVFKVYKPKVVDQWKEGGLLYGKFEWSEHTYIEFGFEKFGRKVSHFIHCRIPENLTKQKEAKQLIGYLVEMYPTIEVFYDDDFVKDFNNGKVYHEDTHKVVKVFNKKSPTLPIDTLIEVAEGGAEQSKYKYKNARKSIDYDFIYANL